LGLKGFIFNLAENFLSKKMVSYENKINKRRVRSSYFSVVISLSLVLFMIGIIGILLINARQFSNFVKENISLEVIFSNGAKKETIDQFVKNVQRADYTLKKRFISKKQALIEARKATGMTEDDPFYNELIYPASLQVYLKAAYVEPQKADSIAQKLKAEAGVSEIHYPKNELRVIYQNIHKINLGALIIAGLFLIIAILLIHHAIRLNIYAKRFTIKTMQLIGAKKSFIRRPFLWKGVCIGLVSALLALLTLCGILYYLFTYQKVFQAPFTLDYYSLGLLGIGIILLGIILSFISTYFATSKFLRLRTEQLYD